MKIIKENVEAKALDHAVLFELVNIKRAKDPETGAQLTMPTGPRSLPIHYNRYLGKNREVVPESLYEGDTQLFPDSRGATKSYPKPLFFNVSGNFVVTEDNPALYEFLHKHPLNITNPLLTEAMISEARQHPCCFAEVTTERVYQKTEKGQYIKIALLQALNPRTEADKKARKELVVFTSQVYGKSEDVTDGQLNTIIEQTAIIGTSKELPNPLMYEAWYDKLPQEERPQPIEVKKSDVLRELDNCLLRHVKNGKFVVVQKTNTTKVIQTARGVELLEVSAVKDPKVTKSNSFEENATSVLSIIDNTEEGYRNKLVEYASLEQIGHLSPDGEKFLSLFE